VLPLCGASKPVRKKVVAVGCTDWPAHWTNGSIHARHPVTATKRRGSQTDAARRRKGMRLKTGQDNGA
jgi:isopentenyldiphosphate isomerase